MGEEASFGRGILTIRIPKVQEEREESVRVRVGD